MTSLLITLAFAFAAVLIAVSLLAIGKLITGKSKLRPGACGRDPHKLRDEECGTSADCQLCSREMKK